MSHPSPRRRLLVAGLAGSLGLACLAASFLAIRSLIARGGPGRLVADRDLLTWRGPDAKEPRPLAIDGAQARFVLRNVGGAPVRITAVESSCGCATPAVDPAVVAPGGSTNVDVRAAPMLAGERLATVTLKTDSIASPEVILRLRIVGSRRPPFMVEAAGELIFEGDDGAMGPRKITALTLELAASPPRPPEIKSTVPWLEIGPPSLAEEMPHTDPGTVTRKYHYEVAARGGSGESVPSTGDVLVIDPWESRNVATLRAHVAVSAPIRAVPSRVVLRAHPSPGTVGGPVRILLRTRFPARELGVEVEGEDAPLVVGPIVPARDEGLATFTVGLKPGAVPGGRYSLRIRHAASRDRLIIPVSVRPERS